MFGAALRIQRDLLTNGRSNGNGTISSEEDENEDERIYERRARMCSGEYTSETACTDHRKSSRSLTRISMSCCCTLRPTLVC